MRRPLSRVACLLAAVAVLAAGCEQPLPDDDSVATPGQPAAEGSGPEPPAPKSGTKPAIEVPDLPIGHAYNDGTAMRRCLTVAWLPPPDIPDGVTIEVTDVVRSPGHLHGEGLRRMPEPALREEVRLPRRHVQDQGGPVLRTGHRAAAGLVSRAEDVGKDPLSGR
jgi:hypothetical protein